MSQLYRSLGRSPTVVAPRSRSYHGPFGRLFPQLAPWAPDTTTDLDTFFMDFANDHMVERVDTAPSALLGSVTELESEFNGGIPAGYTYFGQFVDHDITFDPTPSGLRSVDPSGLLNFRTPRLDLDCVYGRGPDDQPYFYDGAHPKGAERFLVGQVPGSTLRDVPRNTVGRALIGDMRNDENSIVSQLQLAFLLAHNTLVDRAEQADSPRPFDDARRTLTWLYQWVLWHDFVRRIAVDEVWNCALRRTDGCGGRTVWERQLTDVYDWKHQPFMPVEFSGAAYRFGHSMARNAYQTNDPHRGFQSFAPLFDNSGPADPDDLRGFRPMLAKNVPQWDWFLPMQSSGGPFPQMARRIDTKLSNALSFLHEGPANSPQNVLAFLNLRRGWALELPAGTSVAKHLGYDPVPIEADEIDSLWFYVLKEAASLPGVNRGAMLGRVGSTIVAATFAGLLAGDPASFVNVEPGWEPRSDPLLVDGQDNVDDPAWTVASIIRLAGLPASAGDF
ncbi:MAG: peroxidase family protein [Actinomycetota bacterium]